MAKEIRDIDLEFKHNIMNDKVAWYDINKIIIELDQHDPDITRLKQMLKYIDKCDVYLDLWDRRRNYDQANLDMKIRKRESEISTTRSAEEPAVKQPRINPEPTHVKISSGKKHLTTEKPGKIAKILKVKKTPYIFVENEDSINCYELKSIIILSFCTFIVPCFVNKCPGSQCIKLLDRSHLLSGNLSIKKIWETLKQNGDFTKFAVTEKIEHTCRISFSSKDIQKAEERTSKKIDQMRQKAEQYYKKTLQDEIIKMMSANDCVLESTTSFSCEMTDEENKMSQEADVKTEIL
ncbi:unnamed protein product [Oikopleura dioica]|uniref:Uncharacterized protein n=1 Tax=Oikopleura dioica TaxID=34765 RepID=E4Y7H6_OIKDI|nr:unnamed protein product [Oikopleura dioica]